MTTCNNSVYVQYYLYEYISKTSIYYTGIHWNPLDSTGIHRNPTGLSGITGVRPE